jgi:hypothetical protein
MKRLGTAGEGFLIRAVVVLKRRELYGAGFMKKS